MKKLFLNSIFIFVVFNICDSVNTQSFICPLEESLCKRCIETCPKNQTLVKSPCGCCDNQCVPNIVCPKPRKECLLCRWTCPENQTLELSPCGCCYNRCVPVVPATYEEPKGDNLKVPTNTKFETIWNTSGKRVIIKAPTDQDKEPDCPPIICPNIACDLPECKNGTILVEGGGNCGCCPGCVTPNIGDKCYTEVNSGHQTCGKKLICCNGRCQLPTLSCLEQEPSASLTKPYCPPNACDTVKCGIPTCENGTILVEGAGYCGCCPGCVTPKIGDKCYTQVNTELQTCGKNLTCCNGTCQKPTSNDWMCLDHPCGIFSCPRIQLLCTSGEIAARPRGQCCQQCVKPSPGGECYIDPFTNNSTCGPDLVCCRNGICAEKYALCLT